MKRDPALDGLRGVAVLGVLISHAGAPWLPGGGHGVDAFFVLSGYLITTLLKAEIATNGVLDIIAFWRRRIVRLMPALLLFLAAYAVLGPIFLPQYASSLWRDILFAVTYLMNYAQTFSRSGSPIGHTWSLAIEEQFYLIWPFVVVWLTRRKPDTAMRILALLWCVVTFGRMGIVAVTHEWQAAYLPFHAHCSGLLLGALIVHLPKAPAAVGWAGLAGLLALFVLEPPDWAFRIVAGISAAEIASAALILGLRGRLASALAWRPLSGVGLISYGVYLWHFPISEWAIGRGLGWPVTLAISAGLSLALALASYLTVERWAQRFRSRATLTPKPASIL